MNNIESVLETITASRFGYVIGVDICRERDTWNVRVLADDNVICEVSSCDSLLAALQRAEPWVSDWRQNG